MTFVLLINIFNGVDCIGCGGVEVEKYYFSSGAHRK
jgi:hypothetical protein